MNKNQSRSSRLERLPIRGNYTLIVVFKAPGRLMVPSLGCFWLRKGYYVYTGSAFGEGSVSLRRRVARHLMRKKTKHWHIDYLVASRKARITAVIAGSSSANIECKIAKCIQAIDGATIPMKGFGSSDCRQNCTSHLVYFGDVKVCNVIVNVYNRLTRNVMVLRIT